jgi:hypothetical protein
VRCTPDFFETPSRSSHKGRWILHSIIVILCVNLILPAQNLDFGSARKRFSHMPREKLCGRGVSRGGGTLTAPALVHTLASACAMAVTSPALEGPRFWDQLLQLIEEGHVVPVVGQDLLTIQIDGQSRPLYLWLAEKLAEYLEVPGEGLPETNALHEVASRFLAQGGQLEDIYSAIKSIAPREGVEIPEALLQLARIRPFKLFVTTTFGPLLEMAVNQVRFGGQPRTQVYSYSPSTAQDLEKPLDEMDRPVVFHLFGRLSAVPDYAVTEEDTLEFVYSLQSESHRPNLLLDELSRRQLLLIGSNFPDWLGRFFLRVAKRERLWLARGKTDIVADARLRDDPGFVAFLKGFSSRTKVFQGGGAADFVAELSRRWTERHPESESAAPSPPSAAEARVIGDPLQMLAGSIFLSYASEDRAVVDALRQALEEAGVDVWFDRKALEAGDDYEAKIKRNIENASLFIPILSRATLTPQRRFFRIEWDHAEKVAVQVPSSMRYIIPVAIDDIPPNDPAIPERFRKTNWVRLERDKPNPELIAILRQLFRDYQRTLATRP